MQLSPQGAAEEAEHFQGGAESWGENLSCAQHKGDEVEDQLMVVIAECGAAFARGLRFAVL